jgi:hypothetical protein
MEQDTGHKRKTGRAEEEASKRTEKTEELSRGRTEQDGEIKE